MSIQFHPEGRYMPDRMLVQSLKPIANEAAFNTLPFEQATGVLGFQPAVSQVSGGHDRI